MYSTGQIKKRYEGRQLPISAIRCKRKPNLFVITFERTDGKLTFECAPCRGIQKGIVSRHTSRADRMKCKTTRCSLKTL